MKLEDIKNKTRDAVDYLVQSLESGHSDVLTQYLGAMARFHTYSFGNVMLIARQKPDASNVAGIRTWNSLGRFVKRGEKGILILAPMVGKKRTPNEGTEQTVDAKGTESSLFGFRAVYVFDRLSRDCGRAFARSMESARGQSESPLDNRKAHHRSILLPWATFPHAGVPAIRHPCPRIRVPGANVFTNRQLL